MENPRRIYKDIAIGIGLLAVYFIAGKLGLRLAFVNASATAVWPPTGIALAALLVLGRRFWPVILIGAFLVNLSTSGSVSTSIGIAMGNTLEAVIGAFLVNKFASGVRVFERAQDIFKFAFFAGLFATAISATVGVTTLVSGGLASATHFWPIWLTWWLGDMGGALIVAPIFLVWNFRKIAHWKTKGFWERVVFLFAFLLVSQIIFGPLSSIGRENLPVSFLFLPLLLWAATRFQQRAVAAFIIILSSFAVWGTLHGFGPFAREDQNLSLLLLQAFVSVVSVTSLIVSALISQRKELENNLVDYVRQLAEEKTTAEAIIDSMGEALIVTDEKEQILLANRQAQEILEYDLGQLVGKPLYKTIAMEDEQGSRIAESSLPLRQAITTGKKVIGRNYFVRKDKSRFPADIVATPLVESGQTIGAIKVFRDITQELAIDRAKSEFVGLAWHQLRTPLAIIKWQTARFLDEPNIPEAYKKYGKSIYLTNQRMIELVNAILNVSKIELGALAIEPEATSLVDIANKLLDEFEPEISSKKLKVTKLYQVQLPKVDIDPKLTRIILQNLLANSIKYTHAGGQISIKIALEDSEIHFTVSDSGVGIPPSDQIKIFSKFFRTEPARQIDPNGNGLGMYIVKAIVTELKGKIWFESKVDKGTTFYVTLPLAGMKPQAGIKNLTESKF